MYNIAVMHQHGQGTEENLESAFSWYLKAAEKGHGEAARFTALMYNLGEGTERNVAEALKWFHVAADRGIKKVYNSIASIYFNGEGMEKDYVKAREWSLKAAENGDVNAYMTLYCICTFGGHGVEKDNQQSMKWLQRADPYFGADMVKQFRMQLVRDNPDYLFNLAVWLWKRGDKEDALGEMEYAARAGSEKARAWLKDRGD
jgi:TPR repeat protein